MNPKNIYRETETGLTAEFTQTISEDALEHQISIECEGTVTAGTAGISVLPQGATQYTALRDVADAVLSLDLSAAPHTIRFSGRFTSVKVTPDNDFDGDSFSVTVMGW